MLGKNITVIGGSGGMSQVFGRYFRQHGFKHTFFARNENKLIVIAEHMKVEYELDLKKSVENADIFMNL
ncbi:MAG: hypothetical protein HWN81_20895 [Candidatus Lokiarchaeota archaeon]|nr:hypothetical protein [Candidatus Lokiarchaeota archaeon]